MILRKVFSFVSVFVVVNASFDYSSYYYNENNKVNDNNVNQIVNQFIGDDYNNNNGLNADSIASSSTLLTVSPQCWQSAILLIQRTDNDIAKIDNAETLCANLPESYQKRLALEIAQCHVQDLGKELYKNVNIEIKCTSTDTIIDTNTVQYCLKQLTDIGVNTYTHYITYIQILCIRKTQELYIQYQQNIKNDITTKYTTISNQSLKQLDVMNNMLQKYSEQMITLSNIPNIIKEQITTEFTEQMKDTLIDTFNIELQNRIEDMLTKQSIKHTGMFDNVMEHLQQREIEYHEQHKDWTNYQATVLLKQTKEMEQQRNTINEHNEKMKHLSDIVSATTNHIQPLFGLQSLIQIATTGYTWITFLLYFLGTFNIIWIITRPQCCYIFRKYIFCIVITEAIIELLISIGNIHYNILIDDNVRIEYIRELRRWTLLIECITYIFGILLSTTLFSSTSNKEDKQHHVESISKDLIENLISANVREIVHKQQQQQQQKDNNTVDWYEREEHLQQQSTRPRQLYYDESIHNNSRTYRTVMPHPHHQITTDLSDATTNSNERYYNAKAGSSSRDGNNRFPPITRLSSSSATTNNNTLRKEYINENTRYNVNNNNISRSSQEPSPLQQNHNVHYGQLRHVSPDTLLDVVQQISPSATVYNNTTTTPLLGNQQTDLIQLEGSSSPLRCNNVGEMTDCRSNNSNKNKRPAEASHNEEPNPKKAAIVAVSEEKTMD